MDLPLRSVGLLLLLNTISGVVAGDVKQNFHHILATKPKFASTTYMKVIFKRTKDEIPENCLIGIQAPVQTVSDYIYNRKFVFMKKAAGENGKIVILREKEGTFSNDWEDDFKDVEFTTNNLLTNTFHMKFFIYRTFVFMFLNSQFFGKYVDIKSYNDLNGDHDVRDFFKNEFTVTKDEKTCSDISVQIYFTGSTTAYLNGNTQLPPSNFLPIGQIGVDPQARATVHIFRNPIWQARLGITLAARDFAHDGRKADYRLPGDKQNIFSARMPNSTEHYGFPEESLKPVGASFSLFEKIWKGSGTSQQILTESYLWNKLELVPNANSERDICVGTPEHSSVFSVSLQRGDREERFEQLKDIAQIIKDKRKVNFELLSWPCIAVEAGKIVKQSHVEVDKACKSCKNELPPNSFLFHHVQTDEYSIGPRDLQPVAVRFHLNYDSPLTEYPFTWSPNEFHITPPK